MPLNYSSNQARIIGEDVTITAVYSALPTYTVTVTNGTGDGNYFADDTVQIVADAPPAGQQFAGWTVTGNVTLANALSPTTTFKMPDSAAAVTANYAYKLSSIWSSSHSNGSNRRWPGSRGATRSQIPFRRRRNNSRHSFATRQPAIRALTLEVCGHVRGRDWLMPRLRMRRLQDGRK